MSLSESLFGETNENEAKAAAPSNAIAEDLGNRLIRALDDLFIVEDARQIEQQVRGKTMTAAVFRGRLIGDAEKLYPVIVERFKALGYTPMMERQGQTDVIVAVEGLMQARTFSSPAWLHALLLAVTIITCTLGGAAFQGRDLNAILHHISLNDYGYLWQVIQTGAPFAITLLLILGVHEMGHYIAARRHGVAVTLPYFIPLPFVGILGTMGAVIFIKSPLTSRKQLFDVGIAGPLAGFVVALIAFIIGLSLPPAQGPNRVFYEVFGNEQIGMPLLLQGLGHVFRPDITNLARAVSRQPVALAAWFGMLLTVLNLLPIGQLDGGHVMYTLFGRFAWSIAAVMFGLLLFLGLTILPSLIFFAFLVLLTGLRHPPPGNDITPLNPLRKAIGYGTIVLFFLIGTLAPFPNLFR